MAFGRIDLTFSEEPDIGYRDVKGALRVSGSSINRASRKTSGTTRCARRAPNPRLTAAGTRHRTTAADSAARFHVPTGRGNGAKTGALSEIEEG